MKKMLIRLLALTLCVALILPVFSGCGGDGSPENQGTAPVDTVPSGSGDSPDPSEPPAKPDVDPNIPVDQPGATDTPEVPGDPEPPDTPSKPNTPNKPNAPEQPSKPTEETILFQQLFDLNNKVEINLDMSDSELQKMQDDYRRYADMGSKSPIYRKGNLIITITTADGAHTYRIDEVGVRMKGNTSRRDFYNAGDGGIYAFIHLKLDFQETFDDEVYYGKDAKVWESKDARKTRKNRTFATLEKLEMRWNKCYDSTYLKETYAYELYRSEGVLAPHTNLCSFDWSGNHMGIYTINEPVDKVFLEKNLPEVDQGGDLYKLGWTHEGASFTNMGSIGMENEDNREFYVYDLKTNKKTSQHESLKNLLTQLNSGKVTKESFGSVVDVDYFLSYAAASYFLGNPDDLRNNYNNCYLYFLQSTGKAVIIPYDYDRCLGVTVDYNPSGHGMTRDNPFANMREGAQGGVADQENPLFIYSVDQGGYYVQEFAQVLERVAGNTLLETATFKQYFDRAEAMYRNNVQPSREFSGGGGRNFSFDLYRTSAFDRQDNISFDDYMAEKMKTFHVHMGKLSEYLDYTRPVPANYYIRGTMNGWNIDDHWGMKEEDGVLTYTIRSGSNFKFKVFDKFADEWLGAEFLAEGTTIAVSEGEHDNIYVAKGGTYRVTYDPEARIITIAAVS